MAKHARFSPSRAHRDLRCVGAAAMELGLADTAGADANQGTAAHFLGAHCLMTNADPVAFIRKEIAVWSDGAGFVPLNIDPPPTYSSFEVDEEMVAAVRKYVQAVQRMAEGFEILIEQAVPISSITGEKDAEGTSDVIALSHVELQVHDYKNGRGVEVFAKDNEQLMEYAVGSLDVAEMIGYTPERVRLVIHQPRMKSGPDEHVMSVADLRAWANDAREKYKACRVAFEHRGNWIKGPDYSYLTAGEKQCRFCKAQAVCPKLAAHVEESVGAEFEVIGEPATSESMTVAGLPDDRLAAKMAACDTIEAWIKAVRAEVERRLLAGSPVEGYKLVKGRKGNRSWRDAVEAEAVLKAMRLKVEEMYDLALISPTSAEKLKEAGTIGPRQWKKVEDLIVRPDGKISVASASDKRDAIEVKPVVDEFEDITTAAPPPIAEGCDLL